jgi:DNA polymerase III epsilon subunit-like protein
MYLFFDTETTGFLKGNDLTNPSQPHVVQLGAALLDGAGTVLETLDLIAKPDGYVIPKEAAEVHRITTEIALEKGVPLKEILERFDALIQKTELVVCHNIAYDRNVMLANYHKQSLHESDLFTNFAGRDTYCTMSSKEVINWCALPPTQKMKNAGRFHYKTPNLTELHTKCFGEGFGDAHNAFADVKATANVFFFLKKQGIINR